MGANYQRALMWPAITVVVTIVIAWLESEIIEETGAILTTAVFAPWLTLVGLWGGWLTVSTGGKYWDAAIVGVALWAVCAVLDIILFGYASDFGFAAVKGDAIGGSSVILFGALVGGGWAATKTAKA